MKIKRMRKCKHQFQQGDLLSVTLTDSGGNKYVKCPLRGWMVICEVATTGHVIQATFMPEGSNGYGAVIWPKFKLHLLIRGTHGDTSPFAAFQTLKKRSRLTEFVNAK